YRYIPPSFRDKPACFPLIGFIYKPVFCRCPFTMKRWILLAICAGFHAARADGLDDLIPKLMRERQIVGLSLAIVENGRIVKAQGYGFADKDGKKPVTADTLFQAGSISKPVFASAVLCLVEQNRLSLDADVNTMLRSWKVPENEFTKENKVTL